MVFRYYGLIIRFISVWVEMKVVKKSKKRRKMIILLYGFFCNLIFRLVLLF